MPEKIFHFGANSTMAPHSSMRIESWSAKKRSFCRFLGLNGRGAKIIFDAISELSVEPRQYGK